MMILLKRRHREIRLQASSDRSTPQSSIFQKNLKPSLFLFFLLLFVTAGSIYLSKERKPKEDFYEIKDGEPVLAPWREEKLFRELEEIDEAVQYALVATVAGDYPCFSCPNGQNRIYLAHGHTWKYGTTRKGETGRYRGQLPDPRLLFVSQFQGTYGDCLKEEKRKIYLYGILPENQVRAVPLIRPPGNKNDG